MNDLAPGALAKEITGTLHALEGRLEGALEPLGLSLAKFGVLSTLVASKEPLPLRLLAEQCSCVRSNITQLVDRLEAEKLVRRAGARAWSICSCLCATVSDVFLRIIVHG